MESGGLAFKKLAPRPGWLFLSLLQSTYQMKAIIPVAGMGSRLRPHTNTQPKSLVPVAGNTILGHIIESLMGAGVTDFVFIVGYLGDKVEQYVKSAYWHIKAEFVVQEPREGSGHALYIAREFFRNEPEILIILGDTIVDANLKQISKSEHSLLAVKKVDQPSLFGVAEVDDAGFVQRVVEKPRIPKSNFAMVGLYYIKSPAMLAEALEEIIRNDIRTNNEFYLTDALMVMIKKQEKFVIYPVDHWFDCGRKDTLLAANATLLNRPEFVTADYTRFPRTIIIPPVYIGHNCKVSNSIIGPNVAIGDNTYIDYSIVSESIIGSYSELASAVLHHSIIGSDASLHGLSQSLNIGDNTELNLGK
jgi:glucose-1-phosphate thymidylyltransferase